MRLFLMGAAFVGTAVPLYFFILHFAEFGFSPIHIVANLFANNVGSGFTVDIIVSIAVFLAWTFFEYQDKRRQWYILVISSCFIGLSLSLPLHLLMKLNEREQASQPKAR